MTKRVAELMAKRPALEAKIASRLREHYRRWRRLPSSAAATLVDEATRARIIAIGEIEHVLGVAAFRLFLRSAWHRLRGR